MSELRANTISDAAGTGPVTLTGQSAAKAWVNYDQVTPSLDGSYNASSVTDNGTGNSTVNFTNDMANATYAPISGNGRDLNDNTVYGAHVLLGNLSDTYTTSAHQFRSASTTDSAVDFPQVTFVYMGDLA